ncbi:MAG TPA: NUDIX hydrolase [Candidatus Saccharimonadia bacterium]|nr:NUDIX hydrolase [Candidatus Saccharimonadia bacterium]
MNEIDKRLTTVGTCLYRVSLKIIVIRRHELLVVKENAGWYSLPGGGWDYGEELREALARELREEIDLDINDVTMSDNPVYIAHGGTQDGMPRLFLLFRADLADDATVKDKERTVRWVNAPAFETLPVGPNTEHARKHILGLLQSS